MTAGEFRKGPWWENPDAPRSTALREYTALLEELLTRRARRGALTDDEEEYFANALHDCRSCMSDEDQKQIGGLASTSKESPGFDSQGSD